ncbi:MAG: HD domain-containing protein, partial [Planctomycetota bacterium]
MPSMSTDRRFINQLGPNERIEGPYSIANAQLGKTRQDKPYLRCLIGDKTGELPGRMWSIDEATFRRLPTEGFVWIQGETQPYQGELQLIIHQIDPVEPTPEQLTELLPSTDKDVGAMFAEVAGYLEELKHPAMRALAETYLADDFLMQQFRTAPAAKSMHHAHLGGLLEHTVNLMRLGRLICPLYPKINQDLVVFGLFIHDLGKTRELIYDRTFGYSDRGELVGHIVEGAFMLREKVHETMARTGQRLPAGAALVLEHIVLSHHGIPE